MELDIAMAVQCVIIYNTHRHIYVEQFIMISRSYINNTTIVLYWLQ